MMSVSRFALGAALALGGSAVLFTTAADAQRNRSDQRQQQQTTVQAQGRTLNLSREERAALVPLEAAVRGTDRAAQDAALASASAAARGADARHAVATFQFQIGRQRNDNAMMLQALDVLTTSSAVPPAELPNYLDVQLRLALAQRDTARTERALSRLLQIRPNDPELLAASAQLQVQQNKPAEAVELIQRAVAARQAAGQPVPESWLRFGLANSFNSQNPTLRARALGFARGLVGGFPTAVNWRDALLVLRDTSNFDAAAQLDLYRLMLAAGALAGERDYYEFANTLNQGGYPAEAKAVLDAGVRNRMIDAGRSPFRELIATAGGRIAADRADLPNSQRAALAAANGTPALRTADAFFGHGRYPDAIALYRAALQKGGVDPNVVNTRLGIALALAGQRAEAEAAFRVVTGPRAELANFWMLWLQQPAR